MTVDAAIVKTDVQLDVGIQPTVRAISIPINLLSMLIEQERPQCLNLKRPLQRGWRKQLRSEVLVTTEKKRKKNIS